jgi:hypothetical protein
MANNESKIRECPYCKEDIRVDAIKCKHCSSSVSAEKPAHEGKCPFFKEDINPEAIKCYHCKSMLDSTLSAPTTMGCCCNKQTKIGSLARLGHGLPGPRLPPDEILPICLYYCWDGVNTNLDCVLKCLSDFGGFKSSGNVFK